MSPPPFPSPTQTHLKSEVTPVPEYEDIPTPPQPGGNIRTNKQEGTSSAPPQMEGYVINEQKKKMTQLPQGKKDNPKTIREYKKKKNKIHNEQDKRK